MTLTKTSRLELLVARDDGAFRLYAVGWVPAELRALLNDHGEADRIEFDPKALDSFMWAGDAPYRCTEIAAGYEVEATGRSADHLARYVISAVGTATLS